MRSLNQTIANLCKSTLDQGSELKFCLSVTKNHCLNQLTDFKV